MRHAPNRARRQLVARAKAIDVMESPYQWFDANKIAAVVTQTKKNDPHGKSSLAVPHSATTRPSKSLRGRRARSLSHADCCAAAAALAVFLLDRHVCG